MFFQGIYLSFIYTLLHWELYNFQSDGKRRDFIFINGIRQSLDLVALICYWKLKQKYPGWSSSFYEGDGVSLLIKSDCMLKTQPFHISLKSFKQTFNQMEFHWSAPSETALYLLQESQGLFPLHPQNSLTHYTTDKVREAVFKKLTVLLDSR